MPSAPSEPSPFASPSGDDPESTRDALLTVGAEIFAELGFDGARVEGIARRAGVNKAMINYHFGGKEGLYTAILAATFEDAGRRLQKVRESEEPADVRLRRFIEAFSDAVRRRPALPAMIVREVITGGRHIDDKALPYFLEIFGTVQQILERGIDDGDFRPVDPFLTHLSLTGSLVFFFITQPLRERLVEEDKLPVGLPSTDEYVEHLKELTARGLTREADPGDDDRREEATER